MKRYVSALIVTSCLISSLVYQFLSPTPSRAQGQPGVKLGAPPSPAETPPGGNVANRVAGHLPRPSLQCNECHGAGKTLPYLGGAFFHTQDHKAYQEGHHARALQSGRKAATCVDCHTVEGRMDTILPASDPRSTINRTNIARTCSRCHADPSVMKASGISERTFLAYQESAHARAVARGNPSAAVCTDCHRSHDIMPASDSRSSIFKFNLPQTCGQCHGGIAAEFTQSIHGQSISRGNTQSPSCTDCHGVHSIKPRTDSRQILGTLSCAHCHEGVRLTQEFGLPAGRVSSYEESYHGLARRLGSGVAADCASCHGIHNILPSSDPKSMINPANRVQTCGQCHPGATQNFALGQVHLNLPASRDPGSIGNRWVRWVYLPLILLTIGGMLFHNALVWRRKALTKLRSEHRTVLRLTANQRFQHWLLLTSFLLLMLSGFALVYPQSWVAYLTFGAAETTRRLLHRVAAVVMMAVGLYHLAYLLLTREGRRWVKDMVPKWKDLADLGQNVRYYLGRSTSKPKIARFGYAEKAEYWAVIWGTIIMGLTGLMIWFKLGAFDFLPRWAIDIAISVHFYEAVLATLAIIVWHFYHVIFDPDVYPLNWAFYDGRVSEELYQEEHALAYEELTPGKPEAKGERDHPEPPKPGFGQEAPGAAD